MAGALLVLMHECGLQPPAGEGLAICINSAVPEGKGASSSAALEVATMSAMAAAFGVPLEGRRLALLCQRVRRGPDSLVKGWTGINFEKFEIQLIMSALATASMGGPSPLPEGLDADRFAHTSCMSVTFLFAKQEFS